MKKTFILIIIAIFGLHAIPCTAGDAADELRIFLKTSDDFTPRQKDVLSTAAQITGNNRAFGIAIVDKECIGVAVAIINPQSRMSQEMTLRSITGQLQLRVYAEVIREKNMPAQILAILPLTDNRRNSLLLLNWTSLVKFNISPGVAPISCITDKKNNRLFLRYILPLDKVVFSPEENKTRFQTSIGHRIQTELGKALLEKDDNAAAAQTEELRKLGFVCPEYNAALYYLALTGNKEKTTVDETFVPLKKDFNALPENLRQLITEIAEKYGRSDDLNELKPVD